MTTEDFYAFGSKYLGTYCKELSHPSDVVCFRNSRGSVSSIDTATGEITIGNTPGSITIISAHEFKDEVEIGRAHV